MNKSKKLIFAFFISAAIMNSNSILNKTIHAAELAPDPKSNAYTSSTNIFTKYGYKGQCTWFTYGRTIEKLGISLPSEFYGNAVDWWYANSKDNVYAYGTDPKPNSIAVWGGGNHGYGHVAFVENVDGNTVYFNEGNFTIRGDYDGKLKTLSKEAIKDRGNLHLKGYIYLNEKNPSNAPSKSSIPDTPINNVPSTSSNESFVKNGTVNLSSKDSTLNVRSNNNLSSNIIGSLKSGDSVNIVDTYGDWYKIKFNSSYGYVNSKYITTSSNSASNTNNTLSANNLTSNKLGVINLKDKSSALKFRSTPNGQVIGNLPHGTKVNILDLVSGWYKVNLNGTIGYLSSSYVLVSEPNSTAVESTAATQVSKTGTVSLSNASSTLNLRNTPWTGRILSVLPYGSKVDILGTTGRWYKVKYNSNVGYVHSDYIKV